MGYSGHVAEGRYRAPYFKHGLATRSRPPSEERMLDSKQIKTLGLRFARSLQTTVKTEGVFTVEHKSCERPIQQSFLLLNNLIKEVGQFTFGFIDNQVMLNNLLTNEPSLRSLETDFLKRGIAALTFEPGLTVARYTKVISL